MRDYPLKQLVEVREVRKRLAMDTLREKQALQARASAKTAAAQSTMEQLLDLRRQQQSKLTKGGRDVLDALALQWRDRHVAHLADQAGAAATALEKAARAQQEAEAEVAEALCGYHRTVAKSEALAVCEQRWLASQRQLAVRGEEVALDDIVQRQATRPQK